MLLFLVLVLPFVPITWSTIQSEKDKFHYLSCQSLRWSFPFRWPGRGAAVLVPSMRERLCTGTPHIPNGEFTFPHSNLQAYRKLGLLLSSLLMGLIGADLGCKPTQQPFLVSHQLLTWNTCSVHSHCLRIHYVAFWLTWQSCSAPFPPMQSPRFNFAPGTMYSSSGRPSTGGREQNTAEN